MKCNNDLCIHNFGKECELEEISIDWRGNCENMQSVYFPQKTIRSHKLYTQAFLETRLIYDKNTGKYNCLKSNKSK